MPPARWRAAVDYLLHIYVQSSWGPCDSFWTFDQTFLERSQTPKLESFMAFNKSWRQTSLPGNKEVMRPSSR